MPWEGSSRAPRLARVVALLALGCDATVPPSHDAGRADGGVADAGRDASRPVDAGAPERVLFVGNSYTYTNDLPSVVAAIATATPGAPTIDVESITRGGATLADHWTSTGARERIAMGGLDAVVLQGQSLEPVSDGPSFQRHAELFAGAIAEAGARGVWFATWGRRDVEAEPRALARAIEDAYRTAAAHNGDVVARVGEAWEIAKLVLPEVDLYASDGSHPSPAGTLLAACVIFEALTGRAPRVPDPPPLDLPADVARALCAIADDGVRCDAEQSFCDGACIDWSPASCGGCGRACAAGDPCRAGVCGCDAGRTGCDGICRSLAVDPEHCGACGRSCERATCSGGACVCPSTSYRDVYGYDLSVHDPGCAGPSDAGSLPCRAAAHRYCATLGGDLGCYTTGFGPPTGHAPAPVAILCVDAALHTVGYPELVAHDAGCDGPGALLTPSCTTAIHRFCIAAGAASGFGPIETAGDSPTIACVPGATVVRTTFSALSSFASRCTADSITCTAAAWNYCDSLGHAGGYGPVETPGEDVDVVCIAR